MTFRPNVVYPPGVLDCRGSDRSRVLGDALTNPGLVVIAGPRGSGKTAMVRAAGVPLLAARALAPLRHRAGLPLARAIRTALPVDDVALAAEAVRIRLGERALLVEDVQHADAYTLAVLASVAPAVPIVVTLRTPSPIADRLRAVSRLWLDLPLPPAAVGSSVRTLVGMPVAGPHPQGRRGVLRRPAAAGHHGPRGQGRLQAGRACSVPVSTGCCMRGWPSGRPTGSPRGRRTWPSSRRGCSHRPSGGRCTGDWAPP